MIRAGSLRVGRNPRPGDRPGQPRLPLLWLGRSYWRFLQWQHAAFLLSLFVVPITFLGWISPGFAAFYAREGLELPLRTRGLIAGVHGIARWWLVPVAAVTLLVPPLLQRHGFAMVRLLSTVPARGASAVTAVGLIAALGLGTSDLFRDVRRQVDTKALAEPELVAAMNEAADLDRRSLPFVAVTRGGLVDARARFGKLFLESVGDPERLGNAPPGSTLGPAPAHRTFLGIPGANGAGQGAGAKDVFRWCGTTLAAIPDGALAARTALRIALRHAPRDPTLEELLVEVDIKGGRYVEAMSILRRRAIDTRDRNIARRAAELMAARGLCGDARTFAKEFVGILIEHGSGDPTRTLAEIMAPCASPASPGP